MPIDPDTIDRCIADGFLHEVTSCKDDDPPLTKEGWFRAKLKCGLTIDCPPETLEDTLRFPNGSDPVTCGACLVAP